MDKNWNRGDSSVSGISTGREKMFRHPYSGGQNNHYRKNNDFSGAVYYSKNAKPVLTQAVKKEALQVVLVENELMDSNFSWVKNGGSMCQ
jgi:hypothetical protein